MELETIDFDPEVTAFNVCELIQPKIVPGSVEILCRIGDNVPAYVKGDPGRFHQVLLNLMSNAAKFTKKGEIELALYVEGTRENSLTLHTTVKDSGIGIPADKTKDIFKYFHQVSGSTSRKFGGSGLGLTICKQLSNLMGGDVSVESELGRGSTFHFLAVMEKSGKTVTKGVPHVSLQGKRVLAVDDNEHSLQILSHILRTADMEVTALNRGADVLSSLKTAKKNRQSIDICIIDINMPEINGHEVARIIRENDSLLAKLPLIAFTSSTSGQSRLLSEAGFDGLLAKPVQRTKLIELLERFLGEHNLKKEASIKNALADRHSMDDEINRSIRILLAEDDPINQKLAKFLLTKAGYQLEVVNNGREALAVYCAGPDKYNIILMDVQMPEMDGLEAARAIRKLGFLQIPIIAVTAQAIKGDRRKCLEAGMNDYISKPIKSEVIFAMVKKWVI
jgi:CheY-like chemotaxis protein